MKTRREKGRAAEKLQKNLKSAKYKHQMLQSRNLVQEQSMKTSRVKFTNAINVEITRNLKPSTAHSTPGTKTAKPQAFTSLDQS